MKFSTITLTWMLLACVGLIVGPSPLVYCIEKDSGRFCGIEGRSPTGMPESCCPSDSGQDETPAGVFECDHCIDLVIEGSGEKIAPKNDRPTLNVFLSIDGNLPGVDIVFRPLPSTPMSLARAPSVPIGASKQFADTVVFRI